MNVNSCALEDGRVNGQYFQCQSSYESLVLLPRIFIRNKCACLLQSINYCFLLLPLKYKRRRRAGTADRQKTSNVSDTQIKWPIPGILRVLLAACPPTEAIGCKFFRRRCYLEFVTRTCKHKSLLACPFDNVCEVYLDESNYYSCAPLDTHPPVLSNVLL